MKLGILSDIHEHHAELRKAITILQKVGAEQFVVLGDVFERGERIDETIAILRDVDAVGVWGNHDFGLCMEVSDHLRLRFSTAVLDFMGRLQPRLDIDDCLFTHVEPWLDPTKIEDLWYFEGPPDTPEKLAKSFTAVPHRISFIGHFHRWLLGSSDGIMTWNGERVMTLDHGQRHLVVLHAVCEGYCALFDTKTNELSPFGNLKP